MVLSSFDQPFALLRRSPRGGEFRRQSGGSLDCRDSVQTGRHTTSPHALSVSGPIVSRQMRWPRCGPVTVVVHACSCLKQPSSRDGRADPGSGDNVSPPAGLSCPFGLCDLALRHRNGDLGSAVRVGGLRRCPRHAWSNRGRVTTQGQAVDLCRFFEERAYASARPHRVPHPS